MEVSSGKVPFGQDFAALEPVRRNALRADETSDHAADDSAQGVAIACVYE
jgi:hypothetical protein